MMKMSNLCIHPWIPVSLLDGNIAMVSLEELYKQAESIRDLVLSPIERISVLRLLICITQAALNGPVDAEEKEECQDRIITESLAYLNRWRHSFELYGENGAFLQVSNLKPKKEGAELTPYSKLALSQATGNNSTLFDNAGGSERSYSFSQNAINLLTFQNFSPSGLISEVYWSNTLTAGSATCAPCVAGSALHMFLVGKDILETIWMNLCPKDEIHPPSFFGRPVWEDMPTSPKDSDAVKNAIKSYLGRMVPLSRCVQFKSKGLLLGEGLKIIVSNNQQQGVSYRERSTCIRNKDGKLIEGSLQRSLWRQLPAMLNSFRGQNHWLFRVESLPESFGIWVGALVVNKASILGEMGCCFPNRNAEIFQEQVSNCLDKSLETAQKSEKRLKESIVTYHKRPDDSFEEKNCELALTQSSEIYWNYLGANQSLYFKTAQGVREVDEAWSELCRKAAKHAYDSVCLHSTARQMRAWVVGWNHNIQRKIMNYPQYQPSGEAIQTISWLKSISDDRGTMAELRCLLNPNLLHRGWKAVSRIGGIGSYTKELVAGLFAFHSLHDESCGNLGESLKKLAIKRNTSEKPESSLDVYFRRLLDADRSELPGILQKLFSGLKAEGIPVNYTLLYDDLQFWGERVQHRLAQAYWSNLTTQHDDNSVSE